MTGQVVFVGNQKSSNATIKDYDGTLQAQGDATVFDDLSTSLIGKRLSSTSGSIDYDYSENALAFGANGNIDNDGDVIGWNNQKPHGAKANSTLGMHIHWEQTDDTAREFTMQFRIQGNGELKTTDWTELIITADEDTAIFPYVSGTLNQITRLAYVDWSLVGISSTVQFRLTRSDGVAGTILGTFVDGHVEYDMGGSREEYFK